MSTDTIRAVTLIGPETIEIREYPTPDISEGGAILAVEVCALCGTDYSQFSGRYHRANTPTVGLIPGHELVGTIRDAHPDALRRWGVAIGDRVAVEPNIPCGTCPQCATGRYVSCSSPDAKAYGFVSMDTAPALWGGYAEAMYLTPSTILHKLPDGLDPRRASLFNVLANGFQWACNVPQLEYGQSVLVLGAGQRGLACIAAARASGAGQIITTGLATDARRLEAAKTLGADVAVVVDEVNVVDAVREATGGKMVDIAVDCTAGATGPVIDAVNCVGLGGTVVLAGMKHGKLADGLPVDEIVIEQKRIVGALSASFKAYGQSIAYLSDPGEQLSQYRTHEFPLEEAEQALRILGGDRPEEQPIYVSLVMG
jgi:threonine dehydrogenase-like Zn-dependent dehydrogenase